MVDQKKMEEMNPIVALVQGIYFHVTGSWPLISMRTFLAVGAAASLTDVELSTFLTKASPRSIWEMPL